MNIFSSVALKQDLTGLPVSKSTRGRVYYGHWPYLVFACPNKNSYVYPNATTTCSWSYKTLTNWLIGWWISGFLVDFRLKETFIILSIWNWFWPWRNMSARKFLSAASLRSCGAMNSFLKLGQNCNSQALVRAARSSQIFTRCCSTSFSIKEILPSQDAFALRHIGPRKSERDDMLRMLKLEV